ncbi:Van1 protein [Maudiozyma humilis]|uniref:Van1 protein n=1 Tax=Maudiozyma humilis TaxID=51915 RepID=A0AAV5S3V5_MAUHU|nr:Van1 protein [Kazachstania humilis]
MGLLDRVNRVMGTRRETTPLPTTNSDYANGKGKDKKYVPRTGKSRAAAARRKLAIIVTLTVAAFFLCYRYACGSFGLNLGGTNSPKVSGDPFDLSTISIKVPSYTTQELHDTEYYNYDFEDIDPKVVQKFDQGVEHYLISQYGSDVLTPKDTERYERELEMLLDSSIEKYDLADFRGDAHGTEHRDHVLVLVPLRDAEDVLPLMFKHLMNLTYPHELIDVAFLVSDCSEGDHTLDALLAYSQQLQNGTLSQVFAEMDYVNEKTGGLGVGNTQADTLHLKYMSPEYIAQINKAFKPPFHRDYDKPFRSIQVFQKDFGQVIGQGFSDRHAVKVQGIRRKLMGRARNWLTANALKPYHSWVYWRDADVELCPGSVIEDLMAKDYDVMVPNVWRPLPVFLDSAQPYDLNSWVESQEALNLATTLDEDDVIVEGYAEYPTWRVHLAYLRNENGDPNEVLDLDGVGGVSILAKAKIFRSGVQFPAFTFENHAETEAFGKMAKKMGYRVGGLPHYTLWHIYEPSDDDLKEIAIKEREMKGNNVA